jgi:DNA-binding LacI/PurR family transcriptional regulator
MALDKKDAANPGGAESAGTALYKVVKEDMLRKITGANMSAHQKLPSESAIAKEYGVSKMVGKMALNALEEEGYIYRKPRSGSYKSERDPADGKSQDGAANAHKRFVGVIVPQFDPYCTEIVSGLERYFLQMGYNIVLRLSRATDQLEEDALKELTGMESVAGIVLFPTSRRFCGDQLLRMQLNRYPIVLIDTIFRELSLDSVSHDHYQGAFDMTNYLIDMGHKKIRFLTSALSQAYSRQERVRGFQDAILGRDMIYDKRMVFEFDVEETADQYRNFMDRIASDDTSCVFCGNDYIAIELLNQALARGIRVPEDLSIAGYTDNVFLSYTSIGITTVRQPVNRFCKEVAALLMRRIEDPEKAIESNKIETEIVRRESVKRILAVVNS